MARLDKENVKQKEPIRFNYALDEFKKKGVKIIFINDKRIDIEYKNHTIQFFPFTGWHTGKSIKDGRGIKNLLKQLNNE